ncbi:MAG: hypothetical protein ACFFBP_08290 [Promethearchaeota archaeon]
MRDIEELIERWSSDEFRDNRIERLKEAINILEAHLSEFGRVSSPKAYNFITSQIEHYKFLIRYFSS